MVQHAILQLQLVPAALAAQINVKNPSGIRGSDAVKVNAEVVKNHLSRHGTDRIRAGGIGRRHPLHAVTQRLRTGEVGVTPGS